MRVNQMLSVNLFARVPDDCFTILQKFLKYLLLKTCSKEYELIGRAKEYELMINRFKRVGYSQIEK